MKVIIVGASISGLLCAYKLGQSGFDVTVFDKNTELGYDWYDFVANDFFKILNIENAQESIDHFIKPNMTFDIYNYPKLIRLNQKEEDRELAISRKDLSNFLYSKAKTVSKIYLNTEVQSLIYDNQKLVGVKTKDQNFYASLIIDNSGLNSNLSKDVLSDSQVMYAYRAIFKRNDIKVDDLALCYLRHLGEMGIAWVNIEKEDQVDVLIGRVGGLSLEEALNRLEILKKDNPVIGDELISGGMVYQIPITNPRLKLYENNYVLIGDSAFMTIPLLGSGIINSVIQANYLCEVLINKQDLYDYQKRIYQTLCSNLFEIDLIKKFLLETEENTLIKILNSNLIDEIDITNVYNAIGLNYTFFQLLKKGIKGIMHPIILLTLLKLLRHTKKIKKIIKKIPNEQIKLEKWIAKVRKIQSNLLI